MTTMVSYPHLILTHPHPILTSSSPYPHLILASPSRNFGSDCVSPQHIGNTCDAVALKAKFYKARHRDTQPSAHVLPG